MTPKKLSRLAFFKTGLASAAGAGLLATLFGARQASAVSAAHEGKVRSGTVRAAQRTVVRPEGLR